MVKARASTKDIVAPGQIGWVYFTEGHIEIAVKVIKSRDGTLFVSIPTIRRAEIRVKVVNFAQKDVWLKLSKELIAFFRREVGEDFIDASKPERPFKARQAKLPGSI